MKNLFALVLTGIISLCCVTNLFGQVDQSTAWWYNETFESYELGTDMKTGWTDNGGSPAVLIQSVGTNTGSATGQVLGVSLGSGNTFGETTTSGNRGIYKSFDNALSGIVYVKTSIYHCTYGTLYSLKNTSGDVVFEFGSNNTNNANNALFFTGKTQSEIALGNRANWSHFEFLLDLNTHTALKVIVTFNGTSKTFSDIPFTNGSDIKRMDITMYKGAGAAGFDNTTFGSLIADKIKSLTGDAELQTLGETEVTKNFSVTSFTTAMELDVDIANPALNIQWSVSDWGGLSSADQALVSITRNTEDYRIAALKTTDALSASATITLQAQCGEITVTKNVLLKAPDTSVLKEALLAEIAVATGLKNAVTDNNPYIASAKTTLTGAINAAQVVYDNENANIAAIAQAIAALQTAEANFEAALVPYNAFVAYIATVQGIYDAETRTAAFFTAIKTTLNTAIGNATTARTTLASESDIAAAKTALETALSQFNADILVYTGLENAITTVNTKLTAVALREGTEFLNWDPDKIAVLSTAKATAETTLSTATTATALTEATTTLNAALTAFNNEGQVAPNTVLSYKIYTYGIADGNGNDEKKILYADGNALKYSTSLTVGNAEWIIVKTASTYTIQNKTLGTYLNGSTLSESSSELAFPENSGQDGTFEKDNHFLYAISNSNGRGLEVISDGGFKINAIAARLRYCFQFELLPIETVVWNGSAEDNDWTNSLNWSPAFTPTPEMDVKIPAGLDSYPILKESDDAVCKNISFAPGAEINNQHYLTLAGEASIGYSIAAGRWYMLSMPVKNATANRLYHDDAPAVSLKTFAAAGDNANWQSISPEIGIALGEGFSYQADAAITDGVITGEISDQPSVEVAVPFGQGTSCFALAGNPFLTTIDFSKLVAANTNIITGNYIIWTGNGYTGYTPEGKYGIPDNAFEYDYIAPLQSVIVTKGSAGGTELTFNASMATERALELPANPANKLNITASNEQGSNLTFIANREGGQNTLTDKDARKLFAPVSDVPDIYTLKDGVAVGANIINSNTITIPLGITTTSTGTIQLTFTGMDVYDDQTLIKLIDNGTEITLTGSTYTHEFTLTSAGARVENRFAIQFTPITGINGVSKGQILVYSKDNAIHAVSPASDRIKQIIVYNAQGQVIYSNDRVDASSCTIPLSSKHSEIGIVRLITEKGVQNKKLLLR